MANIEPRKDKNGKIISYRIKVYKGRDNEGKRLKPYTKTWKVPEGWSESKTKKELNKIATRFEDECKAGTVVLDTKQTFQNYAEYVIALKERNGTKHQTITLYKNLLKRINLAIGHIKLTDIRPQHLNQFYEQLARDGMNIKTGGKLSNKTIKEHHNLISTILIQAEKEMLVPYNAATKSSPPTSIRKQVGYFEANEIKKIFEILKTEPLKWQLIIHLLATSGCRRGEILGLKWNNVDFAKEQIYINNNLLYTKEKGIYEDTPKTKSSIRYVTLPIQTIQLLKKYKKYYSTQKLALGNRWVDLNFVFTQENGLPMHPDSPTNYCKKLEKKYNNIICEENKLLPNDEQQREIKITPHIFRHSQASILIFMNVDPVTVSKRLGHAQVSTTSDIYTHIMAKADKEAAKKLESIF